MSVLDRNIISNSVLIIHDNVLSKLFHQNKYTFDSQQSNEHRCAIRHNPVNAQTNTNQICAKSTNQPTHSKHDHYCEDQRRK
nr:MAG TPA: hypothetical protein [Caudoviricetes sp.]